MLALTRKDLISVDGSAGVRAWWLVDSTARTKRPKRYMVIAWGDVAIIRPRVKWPRFSGVEKNPRYGKEPIRVVYLREMERVAVGTIQQVPDLVPLIEMDLSESTPARLEVRLHKRSGVRYSRVATGDDHVYVSTISVDRVGLALGRIRRHDLDLRLFQLGVDKMVLVYHCGLRAVIACRETL